MNIENTRLALKGTKNALLPALDVQAQFVNAGLAGQSNLLGADRTVDPFFIGGFGTAWSQILSRNFPDYSVAFQLSIPLRNRVAKSDMIANQIALRQQEISRQRQVNSLRADVQNALADLEQARITYEAAVESRGLAERIFEGEKKKYELGTIDTSLFLVVNYQRALAAARSAEVAGQSDYAKAKAHLDYVTGDILEANNVSIAEAMKGRVSRPPSDLPVVLH
jgi:outer membrane protein TolC